MAKKNAKAREAARKMVQAEAAKKPARQRPTINPATYTKVCSVGRNCGGQEMLAEGNFFKVRAIADGYASRCKKCWNERGVERTVPPPAAVELVAATRRYPIRPGSTIHTHTIAEERALIKQAEPGVILQGYARVAGMLIPVLARKETDFLDVEARI